MPSSDAAPDAQHGSFASPAPTVARKWQRPAVTRTSEHRATGRRSVVVAVGAALFAIGAVVLEVLSGSAANSPVPAWAERAVPLAWPQPARVLWWLLVAAAAALFRWELHRLGLRQHPIVVALTVVPFLAFAGGIAIGADWATWH